VRAHERDERNACGPHRGQGLLGSRGLRALSWHTGPLSTYTDALGTLNTRSTHAQHTLGWPTELLFGTGGPNRGQGLHTQCETHAPLGVCELQGAAHSMADCMTPPQTARRPLWGSSRTHTYPAGFVGPHATWAACHRILSVMKACTAGCTPADPSCLGTRSAGLSPFQCCHPSEGPSERSLADRSLPYRAPAACLKRTPVACVLLKERALTHMLTHTRAYTHIRSHAHKHTHAHSCTHSPELLCMHMGQTHVQRRHTHTHTHKGSPICLHALMSPMDPWSCSQSRRRGA